MAFFTRTHGNSLPVVNMDIPEGGYASTDTPISAAGPKLDFFSINMQSDASNQLGTNGAIEAVIRTVQQLGVVYTYQLSESAEIMSLAVYPASAWTASTLETAIRALTSVNGFTLSGVDVENNGFNLHNYDYYC
jgi:hypothetical protein